MTILMPISNSVAVTELGELMLCIMKEYYIIMDKSGSGDSIM